MVFHAGGEAEQCQGSDNPVYFRFHESSGYVVIANVDIFSNYGSVGMKKMFFHQKALSALSCGEAGRHLVSLLSHNLVTLVLPLSSVSTLITAPPALLFTLMPCRL